MATKKKENILFLILQKEFFIEILKGVKKTEFRSFTDYYITRLLNLDKEGEIESHKQIDKVHFALGYSKNRPEMVVECKGVFIEHDGEEEKEFLNEENCEFAIDLGEILETKNCENL